MADPCICSDKLYVDDSGNLCILEGAIGLQAILVYTGSGTFTKATYPWLARVHVLVVGAGAGGGGAPTHTAVQVSAGSGGGAGGAAEAVVDEGSLAASTVVTVGAGTVGVTAGTAATGGTSSFGAHAVATGGAGGDTGIAQGATFAAFDGGTGGVGTAGDVFYQGGDGQDGLARGPDQVNIAIGGAGGASLLVPSRWNAMVSGSWSPGLATQLQNKGFGGQGAASSFSLGASAQRGADGSDGLVVVRLYA